MVPPRRSTGPGVKTRLPVGLLRPAGRSTWSRCGRSAGLIGTSWLLALSMPPTAAAVLEHVEPRARRAVGQDAGVELPRRLVHPRERAVAWSLSHPDAAVVEVGLVDGLALGLDREEGEAGRRHGDDDPERDSCAPARDRSHVLGAPVLLVVLVRGRARGGAGRAGHRAGRGRGAHPAGADSGPRGRARRAARGRPPSPDGSTARARRAVPCGWSASLPTPPCRPRVPASASFWQTLSSLRLNCVTVQPSRSAAAAEDGIWFVPASRRRRNGSHSATTSSFWSGVNDTRPTVAAPTSSSASAEPSAGASAVTDRKAGLVDEDLEVVGRRAGREPDDELRSIASGIRAPGLSQAWKRPCSSATVAVSVDPVLLSHQKPFSKRDDEEGAVQVGVVVDLDVAGATDGQTASPATRSTPRRRTRRSPCCGSRSGPLNPCRHARALAPAANDGQTRGVTEACGDLAVSVPRVPSRPSGVHPLAYSGSRRRSVRRGDGSGLRASLRRLALDVGAR